MEYESYTDIRKYPNFEKISKSDSIKEAACGAAVINFITVHYREKNNLPEYLQENLLPFLKSQEDKTISSTAS